MADSHSKSKSPAFQFYPKDFITDEHVELMSLAERGAYITLICKCWIEGSLPADVARLARLCGSPLPAFRRLWLAIEPCFRPLADGQRFVHPRLERERRKQSAFRRRQADNGRLGGRPKKNPQESQNEKGLGSSGLVKTEPRKSSSSSVFDLRSSTSVKRESLSPSSDDRLSDRAAAFLERYQALYQKHRKGAHYHHRPIDFQHALELCRTWEDDTRLDKIAIVFLTTDHKFAEEGSRTVGQLAAMASWCDGRIAEAGLA